MHEDAAYRTMMASSSAEAQRTQRTRPCCRPVHACVESLTASRLAKDAVPDDFRERAVLVRCVSVTIRAQERLWTGGSGGAPVLLHQ